MNKRAVIGVAAAAAGIAGAAISLHLSAQLLELGVTQNLNLWFEADAPRAFLNLTDRGSDHYRTAVHPAASLLLSTPTLLLMKLGLSAETAARLIMALGAGCLASAFFFLVWRVSRKLLDAAVFTALLLASSAFVFFSPVFELYAWAGFTVVVALVAATVMGRFRRVALIAGSVASFSITITNGMAGMAAGLVRRGPKKAIYDGLIALGYLAVLVAVQNNLYPTTGRFLSILEERQYTDTNLTERAIDVPRIALVGSVVFDRMSPAVDHVGNPFVTAQSGPTTLGWAGGAAALGWILLLAGGVAAAWRLRNSGNETARSLARIVLIVTAGQLLLHLVYGSETFLYSLHFAPLLIFCASFLSLTRWRVQALTLTAFTASLAAFHNADQFGKAHAAASRLMFEAERYPHTPRQVTLDGMARRPDDLWPRGVGHVAIGVPGAPAAQKGWIEPGGSFSPGERSFGVAIWMPGDAPQSSDTISLDRISQQFLPDGEAGVSVKTPWYAADWRAVEMGAWSFNLAPVQEGPLEVVLRSVGPAGGPIRTVEQTADGLLINGRWRVIAESGLTLLDIGSELEPGWMQRRELAEFAEFEDGWGVVRFEVNGPARMSIIDPDATPAYSSLERMPVGSGIKVDGGDARLAAALDAQVTQILMGAVREEARPGDPLNYPLAWQRDSAFIVAALVRAGRTDAARALSIDLAQRDFFGGFGAEADAPGLALWALGTVSRGLDDPDYDVQIYDDVYRKAEFILRMAQTTEPIRAAFSGPVVPDFVDDPEIDLVADLPSGGLISGRMDWHRPRMFITAASIRGLEEAVRLARRVGDVDSIDRWSDAAAELRESYDRAMQAGVERDNQRTLIFPLDYKQGAPERAAFERALEADWNKTRSESGAFKERPLWTYFDLAIARQHLRAGRADRVWSTVEYFWSESPAPGLYTLWEGNKEENTFNRWPNSRGWARPAHVTPHYWASAEMALVLVDMLAFVGSGELVIGAGVQEAWLDEPMSVQGLITEAGEVSWRWDGEDLTVTVCDDNVVVRGAGPFADEDITVKRC